MFVNTIVPETTEISPDVTTGEEPERVSVLEPTNRVPPVRVKTPLTLALFDSVTV